MRRLAERAAQAALCHRPAGAPAGAVAATEPPPGRADQGLGLLWRRRLQLPALLLLEVASPFWLLIQQALLVAHPIVAPWAGDRLLRWAGGLEDGEALEEARRRLAG